MTTTTITSIFKDLCLCFPPPLHVPKSGFLYHSNILKEHKGILLKHTGYPNSVHFITQLTQLVGSGFAKSGPRPAAAPA